MHSTTHTRILRTKFTSRSIRSGGVLCGVVGLFASVLMTIAVSPPAYATTFPIRQISGQVGGFSVNDRGDVAYVAGGTVQVAHVDGVVTTVGPGGTPELSDAGHLVFLDSDDAFRRASTLTLLGPNGQVIRQVYSGDPIAGGGTLGGFPAGFGNVDVNDAGTVAFANLAGGIFTNTGITQPAITVGDVLSGGATASNFCGSAGVDAGGDATGTVDASDLSLVLGQRTPSGITTVVRSGDATPLGGTFGRGFGCSTVLAHTTNDVGQVAFPSDLAGASSPAGIFLSTPGGGLSTVTALGQPSPVGGTFAGFSASSVALNDSGQVSFRGIVAGGQVSTGIFVASEGAICPVVVPGDLAPDGGAFLDVGSGDVGSTMADGYIAFRGATTISPNALFVAKVPARGACSPFRFEGFFQPVQNTPSMNLVTAGQAVPLKFRLGGDFGLDIFAAGSPASRRVTCDLNAPLAPLEETVTAGGSSLSFSSGSGQYLYVWKTRPEWSGTCQELVLTFVDGSQRSALFKFR